MKRTLLCFVLTLSLTACGKYGPPLPPEALSPRAVAELEAIAASDGVKFTWRGVDNDRRGKELKDLGGYKIYRREINIAHEVSDKTDKESEYQLLATIEDKHIAELRRIREEALAAGKPARRLKVNDALKAFQYVDASAQNGTIYLYRLVPFNQGQVEGQVNKIVKVLFKGEASEIHLINSSQEDELEAIF